MEFGGFNARGGNTALDVGGFSKKAQSLQELSSSITSVQTAISGISSSFDQAAQSAAMFAETVTSTLETIQSTVSSVSSTIGSEFSSGFQTASSASSSMASSVIADMQAIESAANAAASAVSSVGSSGGGGFGGFGLFASGGYTGNAPTNRPTGIVHGQEFVVPADATRKYRPMLEAMRAGRSINTGAVPTVLGSAGGSINVQIDNYGRSNFEVQQLSPSDIRIIAREESKRVVRKETGAIVASGLANPNSQVSKSLGNSTQTVRRRS